MKTFYIKLRWDDKFGVGTKIDPFNGYLFDEAIKKIKELTYPNPDEIITIRIQDGVYKTKGVAVGKNWIILGAGMDSTFIELIDVKNTHYHHPNIQVIGTAWYGTDDPPWANYLKVSDITLDAKWFDQSEKLTPNIKYAGLHAQVTRGLIQRVKVKNYGSNGAVLDHAEVFPLSLSTYGAEDTQIIIQDCIVESQQRTGAGYTSAIMVQTYQNQGDRIPFGTRTSTAAIIRRNRVMGTYGSAYGCGHSENVIFEKNKAYGCLSAFNCDTGKNRNIKFTYNSFLNCHEGIHIGNVSSGPFENIEITNNTFTLTDPWLNKYTEKPTVFYSFGVRFGGNTINKKVLNNKFKSIYGLKGIENKMYGIGYDSEAVFTETNNEFINIKNKIIDKAPLFEEIIIN